VVAGRTFAINASISPILAISVSVPVVAHVHMISAALGALAGIAGYGARELSKFRVDDYKKILAIGCEEASKWSTSEPTSPVDANSEKDVLEKELQNQGQPIPVWIFALVHRCLQESFIMN
jgi:hypothetical protein